MYRGRIPPKPTRREVRAALDLYRPLPGIEGSDMDKWKPGQPGQCWAFVKDKSEGIHGNENPCPVTPGVAEYKVEGRMGTKNTNVTPGPVIRVWLCPKHREAMRRKGYALSAVVTDDTGR